MTEKPKAPARAFDLSNLFGLEKMPEPALDVSHLVPPGNQVENTGRPASDLLNLDDKRKVLFVVGAGNTGKTVFLRWACQAPRTPWALLTVDTVNRELVHYFPNVATPPAGASAQEWLGRALEAFLKDTSHSAAIDFGGGDTALPGLARELPDLARIMEAADLHPVLLAFLSPRVSDLTALKALDDAGFRPRATALVLNLGRAEGMDAYRPVIGHSVFREAVARGAAIVYMPRLFGAGPAIEQRRISFAAAAADDGPLAVLDRARVHRWLQQMDMVFEPIRSWLP
ncbi:MAG TPA: hypothetical protein VGM38_09490 [Pseudolysinimonas sp.]|jgi:hypothetical protein